MPSLNPSDILFCNAVVKLNLLSVESACFWLDSFRSIDDSTIEFGKMIVNRNVISEQQYRTVIDIVKFAPSFINDNPFVDAKGEVVGSCSKVSQEDCDVTADESTSSVIGRRYANYTIRGSIGRGGLGRVLEGLDRTLNRAVALKELLIKKHSDADKEKDSNAENAESSTVSRRREMLRFLNEVHITGQLQHPGIVPVYQLSINRNGKLFYAMKYVHGHSMGSIFDRETMTQDANKVFHMRMRQLGRLIEVCNAVAYAHSKDVVHRDIKPDNIVLGEHGETVILDWGLAKKLNEDAGVSINGDIEEIITRQKGYFGDEVKAGIPNLSIDGEIIGTPAYIAPEVLAPLDIPVTPRVDVYALGTILYQIITGRFPYDYDNVEHLLQQKANMRPPIDPLRFNPDCPPELAAICRRAIACDPDKRYPDAGALAEELQNFQEGSFVASYQYAPFERLKFKILRHKRASSVILALLILAMMGMMLSVYYGIEAHDANLYADQQANDANLATRRFMRMTETTRQAVDRVPKLQNECLNRSLLIVESLRTFFGNLETDMLSASRDIAGDKNQTTASLTENLKKVVQKNPDLNDVIYVDRSGKVNAIYPETYNYLLGLDYSQRRHVQRVFNEGRPILSDLYISQEGNPALSLCHPVFLESKVRGMINSFFFVNTAFDRLVRAGRGGANASLFRTRILQSNGIILYDSESTSMIGQNMVGSELSRQYPNQTGFFKGVLNSEMGVDRFVKDSSVEQNQFPEYEIGAWQTFRFSQAEWKIVMTIRFRESFGVVPVSF